MSYSNMSDVLNIVSDDELAQLSDLRNIGSIDDAIVIDAIETADAVIDSYIANRVSIIPLLFVPIIIKKISAKLAVCELYSNRLNRLLPEGLNDMKKSCIEILENMRSGKLKLVTDETSNVAGEYRVNKTSDSQIFTNKELNKF